MNLGKKTAIFGGAATAAAVTAAHNADPAAHGAQIAAAVAGHEASATAHGGNLSFAGIRAALRDARRSTRLVCVGDSTADGSDNWPYLLAGRLAAMYPAWSVTSSQWDAANGTYYWKNSHSTGTAGERSILVSGNGYALLPNSAYPTITTGVQRYVFLVDGLDWTVGSKTLCSKFGAAGNRAIRIFTSYQKVIFSFSPDGTNYTDVESTANLPAPTRLYIRVTFNPDNGAGGYEAKFEYSVSGGTWVQIGTTVTGAATATIHNGTSDWYFLQAAAGARLYFAELRTGSNLVSQWPQWIDAMTLTSAAFEGAPVLHLQILGYAGGSYSTWYDSTRLTAAAIDPTALATITALGHNEAAKVGAAHLAEVEAFLTAMRARNYGSQILCTQNPELSSATYWAQHEQRQGELTGIATRLGVGCVDIARRWRDLPGDASDWIAADGMYLHPTAAGYVEWAGWVADYMQP